MKKFSLFFLALLLATNNCIAMNAADINLSNLYDNLLSLRKFGTKKEQSNIFEAMLDEVEVDINGIIMLNDGFTNLVCKTTLLHQAALAGNKNIVELLLTRGADIEAKDLQGNTALHYASTRGHIKAVKTLLKKGALINAKNLKGYSALHTALESGHTEIATLLLKKEAELESRTNKEETPLHIAAHYGLDSGIKLLLKRGANINVLDIYGNTPLHYAACSRRNSRVEFLLDCNAVIDISNNNGQTALLLAMDRGTIEIAFYLLSRGADINATDNNGNTILDYWLTLKNINDSEMTLLHYAVIKQYSNYIDLLCSLNMDINAKDIHGNTPLHLAANNLASATNTNDIIKSENIIKQLMKHHAKKKVKNNQGQTPFNLIPSSYYLKSPTIYKELFTTY